MWAGVLTPYFLSVALETEDMLEDGTGDYQSDSKWEEPRSDTDIL